MSLQGEISLTPNPAFRAMDAVTAKAGNMDKVLSKIGSSFANVFIGAFSARSVISGFRAILDGARDIQKLANQFKISTTEAQLLQAQAERTGQSFSEIASDAERMAEALKSARAAGAATLSPANVAALAGFRADAATGIGSAKNLGLDMWVSAARAFASNPKQFFQGMVKNGFAATAGEAHGNVLAASAFSDAISGLFRLPPEDPTQKALREAGQKWKFVTRRSGWDLSSEEKQAERARLSGIGSGLRGELDVLKQRGLPSDSLRSVGNFLGSSAAGIAQQQNNTLKEMKSLLQAIKENTKDGLGL